MTKIKTICTRALVILGLLLLLGTSLRTCAQREKLDKLTQELQMEMASKDTLTSKYNAQSKSWEYSKTLYRAEASVMKEQLKKYSTKLDSLQKAHKNTEAGFIVDSKVDLNEVWTADTVFADTQDRPIYSYSMKDSLQEGTAVAYPDSLKLKLQFKTGLIGVMSGDKMIVTPTNPKVTITGMEGFIIRQPKVKSKLWPGIAIGVGVGAVATGILLAR